MPDNGGSTSITVLLATLFIIHNKSIDINGLIGVRTFKSLYGIRDQPEQARDISVCGRLRVVYPCPVL